MNKNLKTIIQYSLASVINAVLSFLSTIILTRIISTEAYGTISIFNSASNVLMGIVCLGLDSSYIRFFYSPPDGNNHKQLAAHCFAIPSVFCVFLAVLSSFGFISKPVSAAIGLDSDRLLLMVVVYTFVLTMLRFLNINYRMQEKTLLYIVQSIIITCVGKVSFVVVAYVTSNVIIILSIVTVISALVSLAFLSLPRNEFISFRGFTFKGYKGIYVYALFEAPLYELLYLNSYIPQLVIKRRLGGSELGIYSGIQVFVYMIQVISSGFATFWAPYVYKNYKTKQEEFKDIHELFMIVAVVVLTLILLCGDLLFLFLGKDFRENQNLLGLFLIAPISSILIETTSYGIALEKKNYLSLILHSVCFITNVLLCIALLSGFKLDGIAIASMISAVILLVGQSIIAQKYYRTIRSFWKFVLYVFFLIAISSLYYLLYDKILLFDCIALVFILLFIFTNWWKLKKIVVTYKLQRK